MEKESLINYITKGDKYSKERCWLIAVPLKHDATLPLAI
jgi:hypothetical protein